MPKIAVILLTHFFNAHIATLFERLKREVPEGYDVFLFLNCGDNELVMPSDAGELEKYIMLGNTQSILALPYPKRCRPEGWNGKGWSLPGHEDSNFLLFYNAHPDYDHYWGVEYDVHYEGDWSFFFKRFEASPADLIGTTLYPADLTSDKILDPPVRNASDQLVPHQRMVKGLFPVFRLSKRAIEAIIESYRAGWSGHYEHAWGAIMLERGFEIEDIGGKGLYVKPHNKNVFYFSAHTTYTHSPGNFVFRPVFNRTMKRNNTLWHPVKPDNIYNWHSIYEHGNLANTILEWVKPKIWWIIVWLWFTFVWRKAK